jgi:hypothetical protein
VAPVIGDTLYHVDEVIDVNLPMIDRSRVNMVMLVLCVGHSEGRWSLGDIQWTGLGGNGQLGYCIQAMGGGT